MPDRIEDIPTPLDAAKTIGNAPISLPNSQQRVPVPALGMLYYNRLISSPPSNSSSDVNGAGRVVST